MTYMTATSSVIEPGQRLRPAGKHMFGGMPPAWEVGEVFRGTDGVAYARIHRVGAPRDFKTVSVKALTDQRRFIPI
jgi:hypothetical protein